MLGCRSGVMTRIKQDQPLCINVHGAEHKMHLVNAVDVKKTPEILEYIRLLNRSYWWWKARPQLWKKTAKAAKFFGEGPPLKLRKNCPTRWLYDFKRLQSARRSRKIRMGMYLDLVSKGRRGVRNVVKKTKSGVPKKSKA